MNPYRAEPCPPRRVFTARRYYTARCVYPRSGDPVTKFADAVSHISAAHAVARALRFAKLAAEAALVCLFEADALAAGTCAHTVSAHGTSAISYADALEKAQAQAAMDAQQWCADHQLGTYWTGTQSFTLDCEPPSVGTITSEETRYSYISQEDADARALAAATATAHAEIECTPPEYTSTQTASFTAECQGPYEGEPVTVTKTVTRGSLVSQEDADDLALAAAEAQAEEEAEAALDCVHVVYSSTQTYTATCPEGYTGDPVTVEGHATSSSSQMAADTIAMAIAQEAAEAALACAPIVFTATSTQTAACPEGFQGSAQTVTSTATSIVSQEDAYLQATNLALATATGMLNCVPEGYSASATYEATCPEGFTGTPITATGYGFSYVSQDEADAAALAEAQDSANASLECTPEE